MAAACVAASLGHDCLFLSVTRSNKTTDQLVIIGPSWAAGRSGEWLSLPVASAPGLLGGASLGLLTEIGQQPCPISCALCQKRPWAARPSCQI